MARPGTFPPGKTANPGGLSKEERAARDALRLWLSGDDLRALAQSAYRELLGQLNPLIVKDFFDRVSGKPKETIEATGAEGAPLVPALPDDKLTEVIELLKARKK